MRGRLIVGIIVSSPVGTVFTSSVLIILIVVSGGLTSWAEGSRLSLKGVGQGISEGLQGPGELLRLLEGLCLVETGDDPLKLLDHHHHSLILLLLDDGPSARLLSL